MARGTSNRTRVEVTLSCTVCGSRNYKTTRSKENQAKLSLKKHCRHCGIHTIHIDSK